MDTKVVPITNGEFADRVGCHFTMASRLRNGQRVPSAALLARIVGEFHVEGSDLIDMFNCLTLETEDARSEAFGRWLSVRIFGEYSSAA